MVDSFVPYNSGDKTLYLCRRFKEVPEDNHPYYYDGMPVLIYPIIGFMNIQGTIAPVIVHSNGRTEMVLNECLGGTIFGESNQLRKRTYQHNLDGSYTLIDEVPA